MYRSLLKKSLLLISCLFLITGCKSSRVATSGSGVATECSKNISSKKLTDYQKKILDESLTWIGTPYCYAGADKGSGTDCSGMVMKVFLNLFDYKLPRNSTRQADYCREIRSEDVEPGDLVFFATGKDPSKVSHVGIMIDNNRFIHSSTSKGVCISDVTSPYYTRTFIKFGRLPQISDLKKR